MSDDNKVLGIPVNKYAKVCYVLILVSGAFGLLTSLIGLIGMYVGFGGVFGLLGLIGLALAITALLAFAEDFGDVDLSHFKAIAILFVGFFVFNMIIFNAIFAFGAVGSIITLIITAGELAILFAAYQTHQAGQMATVDNVKKNLIALKNYIQKNKPAVPSEPTEPKE
ncbi:MAG: hypothetical protein AAGB32_05305 [Pseudomonadota bacterium]